MIIDTYLWRYDYRYVLVDLEINNKIFWIFRTIFRHVSFTELISFLEKDTGTTSPPNYQLSGKNWTTDISN